MTHDEAIEIAQRHFTDGLDMLRTAASLLRGRDITPSHATMRTETVLTRAIESLDSTNFAVKREK